MEPIIPELPSIKLEEKVPGDLIGSRIAGFGRLPLCDELVIDYLVPGESEPRRIVLAFSDAGMWIQE